MDKNKKSSVVIPNTNCIFVLNTQNYSNLMMHKQFVVNQTLTHRYTRTFQLNHIVSCMPRQRERREKKRDICFLEALRLYFFFWLFLFVSISFIIRKLSSAQREIVSVCVCVHTFECKPQLFYYIFFPLCVASSSFCSMNKHFGGRTEQK